MTKGALSRYAAVAEIFKELEAAKKANEESAAKMAELARKASEAGASLSDIGDVLGLSKQAVKYRYFKSEGEESPTSTRPRSSQSRKKAA